MQRSLTAQSTTPTASIILAPEQETIMEIYFKATRPDGTDFYTGTIPYTPGKTVRPKSTAAKPRICGPGLLHASDAPGETLIRGHWPCRLFEVTGKPFVGFNGEHKHKAGFKQLTVVREIDPYLAFGPNGRYVAGIIERIRKADWEEIQRLRAAWDAAWVAAWGAARGAAWGAARDAAWDAAWDAVFGTLARDLITAEQYKTLIGPWESVMGKPRMAPKWKGPK